MIRYSLHGSNCLDYNLQEQHMCAKIFVKHKMNIREIGKQMVHCSPDSSRYAILSTVTTRDLLAIQKHN